jgi:hypothetical protein
MTYRTLPKALSLALVLAAASFGTLLVPGTALAETPQDAASGEHASAKSDDAGSAKPKHAAKAKNKAKKGATAKAHTAPKAHAKADKSEKSDKTAAKPAKGKRTAARENKPSGKRAKAPAKNDDGSPQPTSSRGACSGTPVSLDRGGVEADRFPLVDCHGKPTDAAIAKVSVLARPWGASKKSVKKSGRIDAGVLTRIEAVAKKFPGRTITLVGGPSPTSGSGSSAHKAGRAVDLRVDGVENQKVAELCRTLPDTGCGFYPNASFVHIDARAAGAGKSYWIDVSEPGEPPRYVSSWPPSSASGKTESPPK